MDRARGRHFQAIRSQARRGSARQHSSAPISTREGILGLDYRRSPLRCGSAARQSSRANPTSAFSAGPSTSAAGSAAQSDGCQTVANFPTVAAGHAFELLGDIFEIELLGLTVTGTPRLVLEPCNKVLVVGRCVSWPCHRHPLPYLCRTAVHHSRALFRSRGNTRRADATAI